MEKIGERIKRIRKEQRIPVEWVAEKLGVSVSTVYRYENSSIEKIPVLHFQKICEILKTSPAVIMGNADNLNFRDNMENSIPTEFENPQEAMEFVLKMPTLAAFGGYDPEGMSDETIVEFANEILQQLKLVSYKYKR